MVIFLVTANAAIIRISVTVKSVMVVCVIRFFIVKIVESGRSKLKNQKVYGAIIGKAYYIKAISLKEAIEVANDN